MTKLLCSAKPRVERFSPITTPGRARLVAIHEKLWASGTKLKYWIRPNGVEADKNAIRDAFTRWQQITSLIFEETFVGTNAQIRIGFDNDGSWSYVGRDILGIPANQNTMNFGWSVADDPDTALHEIGHTLGMSHEHQNPNSGIHWNKSSVLRSLMGPPNNWSQAQVESNVFATLPPNSEGSTFDSNSIMEYPWGAGMIVEPVEFRNGLTPTPGLSPTDFEWAMRMYPEIESESTLIIGTPIAAILKPGGQEWFQFTAPSEGVYRFTTTGPNDTVLTLFDVEGTFLTGDDDSGLDKNAEFRWGLVRGTKVSLRLRMFWAKANGEVTVDVE